MSWELRFEGYGYGDERNSFGSVHPQAEANRIQYRRGGLTEWYVNGPLGLQQGFTLEAAPGTHEGAPLTLALAVSGDLEAQLGDGAASLTLLAADGSAVLSYCDLTAYDVNGRPMHTWLELSPRTDEDRCAERRSLLIRVDDAGAQYPLVIDPFIQQAKLTASDGTAGDVFGHSVAISGDTVVIGAPYDDLLQGSAYIFVKPETGWATATESARLTASDGVMFDQFGYDVDISGDTVVIGAIGDDVFRGSAYVFVKPDTGWETTTETAKLTASDGASPHYFGDSVAISDDTVAVAAQYGDSFRGSAYVFVKPDTGWETTTETAKLTASDGESWDNLGIHLAISGDTVVVGAWRDDSQRGSAYVFVQPDAGWQTMTETAKLTASDGAPYDQFGFSVAISEDTVVVGAWRDDHRGSAYVFVKPESGWATGTETAKLTASDAAASDQFGNSTAISGDLIVVGAWRDDRSRGSAYAFVKPAGGWVTATETEKLVATDRMSSDHFGTSVDNDAGTVVVGGYGDDSAKGSAYVFGPLSIPLKLRSSGGPVQPASSEVRNRFRRALP